MQSKPSFLTSLGLTALLVLLFLLSLGWLSYGNYLAGSEPWQIAASALMLAVPLGLFYGSIGLFVRAWQQKRSQGQIDQRLAKFILRAPRIAGIAIAVFVGLFALDVFEGDASIWLKLGGFVIHALPALLMGAFLAVAWRYPAAGFWGFLAAAIYFLRFSIGSPLEGLGMVLLFSGPMAAIALLFWVSWKWKKALTPQ